MCSLRTGTLEAGSFLGLWAVLAVAGFCGVDPWMGSSLGCLSLNVATACEFLPRFLGAQRVFQPAALLVNSLVWVSGKLSPLSPAGAVLRSRGKAMKVWVARRKVDSYLTPCGGPGLNDIQVQGFLSPAMPRDTSAPCRPQGHHWGLNQRSPF